MFLFLRLPKRPWRIFLLFGLLYSAQWSMHTFGYSVTLEKGHFPNVLWFNLVLTQLHFTQPPPTHQKPIILNRKKKWAPASKVKALTEKRQDDVIHKSTHFTRCLLRRETSHTTRQRRDVKCENKTMTYNIKAYYFAERERETKRKHEMKLVLQNSYYHVYLSKAKAHKMGRDV